MGSQLLTDARRVADAVSSSGILRVRRSARQQQAHMGALLTDAVLQCGLNYRTVVEPRVHRVLELFPEAQDLPAFSDVVQRYGAHHVLMWKHHEKPRRLRDIVWLLAAEAVETVCELADWLGKEANVARMRRVHGIGPKTIDYMAILAGVDGVAIDRHIEAFIGAAGVAPRDYEDARRIVRIAADLLGVRRASLDRAIWEACSKMRGGRRAHSLEGLLAETSMCHKKEI